MREASGSSRSPTTANGVQAVATFRILDKADEFRIELIGRFAGACVGELRNAWSEKLCKKLGQRFTVDLARMSGWDAGGRKLLRDMHQHGTQFVAGNAETLVFLREISVRVSRGPVLVPEAKAPRKETVTASAPKAVPKAAGG